MDKWNNIRLCCIGHGWSDIAHRLAGKVGEASLGAVTMIIIIINANFAPKLMLQWYCRSCFCRRQQQSHREHLPALLGVRRKNITCTKAITKASSRL